MRASTCALGSAIALVLLEAALRLWIPGSTADLFLYQTAGERHRIMRPDVRATVYGVPIETNALGFRSRREYARTKPASTFRIGVLGDSFTVSAGVRFEALATTRLEAQLQRVVSDATVEVYNFAVGGYGVLHHLATLKEVALAHQPDLLLLFLYPYNDLDLEEYDREASYIAEHAGGAATLDPLEPARPWFERSYLTRVLYWQGQGWIRELGVLDALLREGRFDRVPSRYRQGAASDRALEALGQMARRAESAGAPLRVYLLPLTARGYPAQRPLFEAAAGLVGKAGLPVVSLLPPFEAAGSRPVSYWVTLFDSHPNEAYNERVAEGVAADLRANGPPVLLRAGENR